MTTKSSHIIDSRGTYDGQKTLDGNQIEKVASRFADRWGERFNPKMGHTTHLLMAFPVGTRGTDVRDIAQDVCERFFEQGPSRFDYIVAVHEDRAHPHAHVVLNRRSPDGEMFYLGRDHHFNYDDFREAMVTAAERHGVRLEATRRLERGITSHKAPIEEIHRAKEEGRAPVERQRVGKSLDTALVEIARYSRTYRSLSAIASAENREDLADALFSAGEILAKGGHLKADGVVYMAKDESFDSLVSDFSDRVQQLERVIEDRAPQERAELERRLSDVLQSVSHLNPLGERSHTLDRPPSDGGVYSQGNIDRDNLDRLTDQQTPRPDRRRPSGNRHLLGPGHLPCRDRGGQRCPRAALARGRPSRDRGSRPPGSVEGRRARAGGRSARRRPCQARHGPDRGTGSANRRPPP